MNKTLVVTKARHKGLVIEALYVCVSSNPGRLQGAALQIVPHFITSRHQTPNVFYETLDTCFYCDWSKGTDEYFVIDIRQCEYELRHA